jgi:stage III sporulation protein SpoIIIAA
VTVRDDLDSLLHVLPPGLRSLISEHPRRGELVEVVLDLGRSPEIRGAQGYREVLRAEEITSVELEAAANAVGNFGGDNRAGIAGTLHRISAIRNRRGVVVGLTCRVGRAVSGHADMVRDILDTRESMLFVGCVQP